MTPTELRQLRESLGMTQDDLAAYLGLRHRSQITYRENGRTALTGAELRLLRELAESGGKNFQKNPR